MKNPHLGHVAIITGACGQDGRILGKKLIDHGIHVIGIVKDKNQEGVLHQYNPNVEIIVLDSHDRGVLKQIVLSKKPKYIYNLSAKSSVANSWNAVTETMEVNLMQTLNWLEVLRESNLLETRFYQASSSEMFGIAIESPQTEMTSFHPRSPYGVSKVSAHHLVVNYRESYGLHASSGILFNHESPLRNPNFLSRKISMNVASIARKESDTFSVSSTEISRDWGWAPDYVDGMIKINSAPKPDDFVLATGVSHSISQFLKTAFEYVGIYNWEERVKIDDSQQRPAEIMSLKGDSSKAKRILDWEATTSFVEMVERMVQFDLDLIDGTARSPNWQCF
ncbi:MAG: GDP-mannose 4,6-dehydratase [Bacteroidetes bacterium]|nr:GDP-mannose 4,6-dehydratase [bacterium]NBP64869.1 GDP-mannose 4,6-dehydratase [Bacteroidota bacterium]